MTVSLRPARPSDLGAIERIERASFGNPWPLDAYAQELERDHATLEVAVVRGEGIAGFSCAWHVAEEAHLLRIATSTRFRRRGIGRDLLSAVIARARAASCGRITLEVASANGAAIHLYEAHAFREIGRRSGYYRVPPDDAVVMRLDLEPIRPVVGVDGEVDQQRWTPGGG